MVHDESRDALEATAAEYVLGTLRGGAREEFERTLAADQRLQRLVMAWEERLAALATSIPPVRPPEELWTWIEDEVTGEDQFDTGLYHALAAANRRRRGWRAASVVMATAIAASVAVLLFAPERARDVVERVMPSEPARPVIAVLRPTEETSAWLVRAGLKPDTLAVTPVSTPEAPPDRVFELWAIPAPDAPPRSVGLIAPDATTELSLPPELAARAAEGLTLAVSIEPPGGAPEGVPTGPVVLIGTLQELP